MGTNFHTPWDTDTSYAPNSMNPAIAALDKALTYLKNVIIGSDGNVTYAPSTGVLAWSGPLIVVFTREDGKLVQNIVSAGNITLADGEVAYLDLNETNDTVISVAKAALTALADSPTRTVNRVVLGYRNATSDNFFPVALRMPFSQIGDMSQSVYDTDNDGIVNGAESAPVNTFPIGDGTDADITIQAYNADANKPGIRYNATESKWQYTNDGTSWVDFGTSSGASVAFKTIAVSGQTSVVADAADDTLTLAAGDNVTITTNPDTDTVTIAATGGTTGSVNLWQLLI